MERIIYSYTLDNEIPLEEAQTLLDVAIDSTEALHGSAAVQLDGRFAIDEARRTIVVDAGTVVGRDANRLFTGLLIREFGQENVHIERHEREAESRVIQVTRSTPN